MVGYGLVEGTDALEEGMEVGGWRVWPGVIGEDEMEQVLFGLRVVVVVVVGDKMQV